MADIYDPADTTLHSVSIYCFDYDSAGRVETVDVRAGTGSTSIIIGGPVSVSAYNQGKWVSVSFVGNINILITCTAGPNAVISGIAFD